MNDSDGLFMAKHIYGRILRDGCLDMAAIPSAIGHAVQELRKSGVPASR